MSPLYICVKYRGVENFPYDSVPITKKTQELSYQPNILQIGQSGFRMMYGVVFRRVEYVSEQKRVP